MYDILFRECTEFFTKESYENKGKERSLFTEKIKK